MTVPVAITLAIALLGAVLGVINTWMAYDRNKVKLRVTPKRAVVIPPVPGGERISIEVHNLSSFSITIAEVGFVLHSKRSRSMICAASTIDGKPLPARMEPYSSLTVLTAPVERLNLDMSMVKCAYARTDCDITKEGTSPWLEYEIRQARLTRA